MALRVVRTKVEWCKTFQDIGIPDTESQQYAECFETNGLSEVDIPELDKDTIRELKITKLGHQLAILRVAKIKSTKPKSSGSAAIKLYWIGTYIIYIYIYFIRMGDLWLQT